MKIGSHMSVSGGVDQAFKLAESLSLEAMQIFTRNQTQWKPKPLQSDVIDRYFAERERTAIRLVMSHASYLINLCSNEDEKIHLSMEALRDELTRCDQLDIPWLIMHPGSHLGAGEHAGMALIAENINRVFDTLPDSKTMLLLETTAGQGSNLGFRFEHLREIREMIHNKSRIGYCFDTCHVFASGYDLSTMESTGRVMEEMEGILGFENLKAFHFNDSKKPCGSRLDRHEHIAQGTIGDAAFRWLMQSEKYADHAAILETPKSKDYHEDRENIERLLSYCR